MFRLGDFYEMFDEDAKLTARELDLTLTTRDRGKPKEEQTPMCGVPYHSVDSYIARLVQKGYKVAICEQMEDPATAKGLVQRDITRIITPGTVTESCMLDENKNNYIGCIYGESGKFGLAFCDVSTGAFFTTVCSDAQNVASELGRFAPSEILRYGSNVDCEVIEDAVFRRLNCCVSEGKQELFALESAEKLLENHFHATLSQMGIAGMPAAVIASGALLQTLLTDSQGKKMGKTAGNAVWLDPNKTSPFEFYQYWRNVGDADVMKCIRMLTFLPLEQIDEMATWKDQRLNEAKEILAYELTSMVHGKEEADKAQNAARALFSGAADTEKTEF